jgi:hypothetical protein
MCVQIFFQEILQIPRIPEVMHAFFFFFRYAGFSPHQGHLARPCCRLSAMPKKSAKAKKPEPVRPRNQPSIAQSMLGAKRKEPHDPPSDSESDPSRQVVDLSVDESAEPAADESVSSSDARVQPSWFREFPWMVYKPASNAKPATLDCALCIVRVVLPRTLLYTSGLVEPYFSYSALVYGHQYKPDSLRGCKLSETWPSKHSTS